MSSALVSLEGFCDITVIVHDDSERYKIPTKPPALTRGQLNCQSRLPAVTKRPIQQGYAHEQFIKEKQAQRREKIRRAQQRKSRQASYRAPQSAQRLSHDNRVSHNTDDFITMRCDDISSIDLESADIPMVNPATGLTCLKGSMIDAGGSFYGSNNIDDFNNHLSNDVSCGLSLDAALDSALDMTFEHDIGCDTGFDDF